MTRLQFDGQSALVTGGGGGIGGAVAVALAEFGAFVHVADVSADAASAVVEQIHDAGGSGRAVALDVSSVHGVRQTFADLDECDTPPLDILVNIAGAIRYTPLLEEDEAGFDELVGVNLKGTFFCLQEAARRMVPRGRGAVVNMASTAAFIAGRVPAPVYGMTKGAIRQLTVAAAVELAPYGVRVNAVAPATIRTTFTQGTLQSPDQLEAAAARVPLGRVGLPEDVVGAVVFLSSPFANYITGHTLVIDGGILGRSG